MAGLKLKNIYKRYAGGVTAVTDFNLEIEDKEFIILDYIKPRVKTFGKMLFKLFGK